MKFVELNEKEYKIESEKFAKVNFYQTTNWAKIKNNNGWENYYVGIKKDEKIIALALILSKKILFKNLFYIPRGMILDFHNFELLEFFTENIKKFAYKKNAFVIKIDPLVEYQKHDNLGNIINDFNNEQIVNKLKKLGYKHFGFKVGYTSEAQFRWSYSLNLKNKTVENIYENMDQRCRRCIKKSEKFPLIIKEVDNKNIADFKKIMEHTAKRHNDCDRSINYYKSLQDNFLSDAKLLIVYLDKNSYLANFKDDKLYDVIKNISEDLIPLSAGVFIKDKNCLNYVYGGTYSYFMHFMAQYKLQISMIKYALDKNLDVYDFGGISGDFNKKSKNYGVYEFKKGFGGNVIEYIGEFDLVIKKANYYLYKFLFKFYKIVKKFISRLKHIML